MASDVLKISVRGFYVVCHFFMESQFLLLAVVILQIVSAVVIILVVKNFFRQLMAGMGSTTGPSMPSIFQKPQQTQPFFKEEKNNIPEANPDEMEFSEDNPMNLPEDIKFEVEGGETFAPPEYPVRSQNG